MRPHEQDELCLQGWEGQYKLEMGSNERVQDVMEMTPQLPQLERALSALTCELICFPDENHKAEIAKWLESKSVT